jgi:hypothetical protein
MRRLFCMAIGAGLILFGPAQAQPQSTSCKSVPARNLNSLNELPEQVQVLLERANAGVSGIADIGEKFNSTDVVDDASVPMRRLVKGLMSGTCIWLTIERGGRGYGIEQIEFQLSAQGWSKTATAPLPVIAPGR